MTKYKILTAIIASVMTFSANAASIIDSSNVSVTGELTAQNACATSITNGGNIDVGTSYISNFISGQSQWNTLADVRLTIDIQCTNPTATVIKLSTSNPSSVQNTFTKFEASDGVTVAYIAVRLKESVADVDGTTFNIGYAGDQDIHQIDAALIANYHSGAVGSENNLSPTDGQERNVIAFFDPSTSTLATGMHTSFPLDFIVMTPPVEHWAASIGSATLQLNETITLETYIL